MSNNRILLIEPGYRNKYPPLGLMKLAAYHKKREDVVRFIKGEDHSILYEAWDRVYVTTLFSFEWERTAATIDFAIQVAGNQPERVFVGGISASLMHEEFIKEPRWVGVRFIKGLLDGPPAQALQLSVEDGDFGADDLNSKPIELHTPNYEILDHIDYTYPVHDAYFGYASRGCIRKCHFCGVPKLEGMQREMPPLYELVNGIASQHGEKKDMILMDNNVTASARYKEVIAEICDLGFTKGAVLERDGRRTQRRVDFNQGVDARILAKSPMYLKEMAKICIQPLRIAFDHVGVRKVYDASVRMAADNGITSISNYMLYNFMDSPEDLYTRLKVNIDLNEELGDKLGVRIWSFPMRYQPVTLKDRSHVGRRWNRYYLRSFQLILQASRGVVGANKGFFDRAYGADTNEFLYLLSSPHGFIFNRNYYEYEEGKPIKDEYDVLYRKMSDSQKEELLGYLSQPTGGDNIKRRHYEKLINSGNGIDKLIRDILPFYTLGAKDKFNNSRSILSMFPALNPDPVLPADEEFVEDAGLYEPEPRTPQKPRKSQAIS